MPIPKIGVFLPNDGGPDEPPGDVVAAARRAEDLGFESVWVPDQLVFGTPMTNIDSVMTLAAASAVTERVKLGFGVMVVALRPTVWVAKQVASLQHLSHDRVIFGIGVGEDRHPGSWAAAGVTKSQRGRLTDEALSALPDLIAGHPAKGQDGADFRLLPGATVPPILIGGFTEAALARAAAADGWYGVPVPLPLFEIQRNRLAELAAERGRPAPPITLLVMAAITGDPAVPDRDTVVDTIADPAKKWAFSREHSDAMIRYGSPAAIAEYLAALGEAGVERVVVNAASGTWDRQYELLAETASLLG